MASAVKAITQTLTASTATNDTLTGTWRAVEVTNHSSTDVVYVSIGATVPTVAGTNLDVVLPRERFRTGAQIGPNGTNVRLISAGTPTVTIAGIAD